MKYLRLPVLGLVLASLATQFAPAAELSREHIGDGLFARNVSVRGNETAFYTLSNIRFGRGQGEDLTRWHRREGTEEWTRKPVPLPADHLPGMISTLRLDNGAALYLYVDRQDERRRRIYLQAVTPDGSLRTLFTFAGGRGVLNPRMDLMPDGKLHLLLPDRTAREVRRFIVDPGTGTEERLSDVRLPRRGARIYGRLVRNETLIVPVSVIDELLLLVINLEDQQYQIHSVDRFQSPSGEPPRGTAIYALPETGQLALFYLRPARFSDRSGRHGPRTGLVGEHVCNVIDSETFESLATTVMAGFAAEAAATHNRSIAHAGGRDFLFAHTEVDRIHQRHLTGAYENYVGSYVTRWHIDSAGNARTAARQDIPFMSFFTLATDGNGHAILLCNEAREGDPLYLYAFKDEDLPSVSAGDTGAP